MKLALSLRMKKPAVEFDRKRWLDHEHTQYDCKAADICDDLREAAKELEKHERTH